MTVVGLDPETLWWQADLRTTTYEIPKLLNTKVLKIATTPLDLKILAFHKVIT